jgi:hypothetical protein
MKFSCKTHIVLDLRLTKEILCNLTEGEENQRFECRGPIASLGMLEFFSIYTHVLYFLSVNG